jgi:hypothetical protein
MAFIPRFMIPAVAQTLADFLASGMPLISTELIGFEHPSYQLGQYPSLNLYLYGIHPNQKRAQRKRDCMWNAYVGDPRQRSSLDQSVWFDTAFLLTVQDHTAMGKQHLISEALSHLLQHQYLPNHILSPSLQGHGFIPIKVANVHQNVNFWEALGIPIQPALHITVTIPFAVVKDSISLSV